MDRQFFTDLKNNDVGLLENALPMVTGAIAEPVAGIAAMYHAATGGHDASGVVNAIRDAMTYQPRTDAGKMYQQALGSAVNRIVQSAPVKTWQKGVDIAGQYSPTAGAVLQTVPAAIGVAAGVKPALRAGRAVSGALDRIESFAPRLGKSHPSIGGQAGMIDIWGELLAADKHGGREAAKRRAVEISRANPELSDDVAANYQDLGYSDKIPEIQNRKDAALADNVQTKKTSAIPVDEAALLADAIQNHYDQSRGHQYYGYRVLPDDHMHAEGDYLPDSYQWDDGKTTGINLPGVSALGIDIDSLSKGVNAAIKQRDMYLGKRHAIIATDKPPIIGEDVGEWVMPDARIVKIVRP